MASRTVVRLVVGAADAELAADALWEAGPSAVSQTDGVGGSVRLTADVADLDGLEAAAARSGWVLELVDDDGDGHLDAWRQWAAPVRAGRHLVLQPAWLEPTATAPGDLVVVLDPGRSFGSGSHPTTRLVLALLEDLLRPGDVVLDVGCGSGVLSVGACLLGASWAEAIDLEADAVPVTMANAAANGVADRMAASLTPLADVAGVYDLVVANIGGQVLREAADILGARVAGGGLVLLAGFLTAQVDGVLGAYRPFEEVDRRAEDDWVAVALRRG